MTREILGTQIFTIQKDGPLEKITKSARDLINQGKLVAFPTDTVYGLGTNAFIQKAVEKIFQVKGRDWRKPLAVLIGDLSQLSLLKVEINERAQKLIQKFWPGPLTLIMKSDFYLPGVNVGQTIGVRLPNSELVRKLTYRTGFPIAATSANLSGHLSPTSGEEVIRDLAGKIDLIINAGFIPGMESTVLDVTVTPPHLLREGKIRRDEIMEVIGELNNILPVKNNLVPRKILFVCTGNTCRSAIAEGLMKRILSQQEIVGLQVLSAGTSASFGKEADSLAVLALKEEEVDLSSHRSQPLAPELMRKADLILTMTEKHRNEILSWFPEIRSKVFLLKQFAGIDDGNPNIYDPCTGTLGDYLSCVGEIKQALLHSLDQMLNWLGFKILGGL